MWLILVIIAIAGVASSILVGWKLIALEKQMHRVERHTNSMSERLERLAGEAGEARGRDSERERAKGN